MSRYGDHSPKQELWEAFQHVLAEYNLTWLQLLALLAQIINDVLYYELSSEEV